MKKKLDERDPIGSLMRQERKDKPVKEATCIQCGCTDSRACEGGCSWIWVDRLLGRGLCSSCPIDGI